jgi:hypothetical protein
MPEPEVILMTGQHTPANMTARLRIENATNGSNVVCVALARLDDGAIFILCGGANKMMNVYQLSADNTTSNLGMIWPIARCHVHLAITYKSMF